MGICIGELFVHQSLLVKRNSVPLYEVPGHNDVMLAFPQHKISFNTAIYVESHCIGPSASFLSTRYADDSTDADGAIYTPPK
jgi:hypothetical protein